MFDVQHSNVHIQHYVQPLDAGLKYLTLASSVNNDSLPLIWGVILSHSSILNCSNNPSPRRKSVSTSASQLPGSTSPAKKIVPFFSLPFHNQRYKMKHWVVLGDTEPRVFMQDAVPDVTIKGRKSPPFPVHIQCRTLKHAQEVVGVHGELQRLRSHRMSVTKLASLVYTSPHFSNVMTETTPWYAVLNGKSFKGILLSQSDCNAQTKGYRWASCRSVFCLRDALIHIILGGNNAAFEEINTSLSSYMDRLSLTASSYHSDEIQSGPGFRPNSSGNPYGPASSTTSSSASTSTIKSQHIFRRGRSQAPSNTTTHRHSIPPASPIRKPTGVYKYIRGVAGVIGSITDPSGIDSAVHNDVENVVGAMRAEYLDVHGYRRETVEIIMGAYQSATDVEDFVALASGCGMAVVELEWFWELSWRS
ncbi:hypothetical protein BDM02DRAFT_3193600 [Thelephora ganbajun]|uniref:Uncharacterized protein n=1 Tax=Thelephora ganbajun TaxID=370292 RepID=A0ACB6YYB1_THEGA|nr:hypothetical protein BDM02DRAFT_3193600 [Thelephora ganbajun]